MKILKSLVLAMMSVLPFVVEGADGVEAPKKPAVENVKADQFDALRKSDTNKVVVLDVRTKKEYSEGHIPGSVLIDFTSDDFEQKVSKLDKDKTYLVHCASGGRSARACKKMDQLGFKKLYNLEGGMGAWAKAGKPVEK
jgi:rhodanese-related sulfurtransferase